MRLIKNKAVVFSNQPTYSSMGSLPRDLVWDLVDYRVWKLVYDSMGSPLKGLVWDSMGNFVRVSMWNWARNYDFNQG